MKVQLTTLLLWGCATAVLLWLITVIKLSNRVENTAEFLDTPQQLAIRLAVALDEGRRLRNEVQWLRHAAGKNAPLADLPREKQNAVLRQPKLECDPSKGLYSKEHEVERRELDNQIRELFYYLYDQTQSKGHEKFAYRVMNQTMSLMALSANFGSLVDRSADWHKKELQKITDHIQNKIYNLQHPASCKDTRILICDLNKGCGFGCQLHHVGYCLTVAAASNRTMVLDKDGDGWRYSQNGWTSVFQDVSGCRYKESVPKGESIETWKSVTQTDRLTFLTIIEAIQQRPPHLPLSFPSQLADLLLTHHTNPPVYFQSQFLWYLMRSNKNMEEVLDHAIAKIPFGEGPIVGLQIRRTDKIGTEAAFHSVDEYMKWAEIWFQLQERRHSPEKTLKRKVFIATDDPSAVTEAKKKYPNYEVYADVGIAKSAQVSNRYTDISLYGVVTDVQMLSRCDYLVCTFSSQVCRVGYELMQVRQGDAAENFHSLDDIYYYGGQHAHQQVVYEAHDATDSDEISMNVGDILSIAGNHWNGLSKGTNQHTGRVGLYPSYKVRERWRVIDFPIFTL